MKIIDLLNMISKGEEVPKEIKYDNKIWYWNAQTKEYITTCTICVYRLIPELGHINDEVEIIEEDKKIKKIISLNTFGNLDELVNIKDKQHLNNQILKNKINEIIDEINKLKKEGNNE